MFATRFPLLVIGSMALLLQACAAEPVAPEVPAIAEKKPAAEITLNMPSQTSEVCTPAQDSGVDHTFLDKGFSALVKGDHEEAVNYFRRYQRLESSPGVDWEAGIAIAYDKMMPDSPYYNWRTAAESYRRLMRRVPEGIEIHPQIQVLQGALALLIELHVRIDDQQDEQDVLKENLEKREEALKRLRELTLGQ